MREKRREKKRKVGAMVKIMFQKIMVVSLVYGFTLPRSPFQERELG